MSERAHNAIDLTVTIVMTVILFAGLLFFPQWALVIISIVAAAWVRFNLIMLRRERSSRY